MNLRSLFATAVFTCLSTAAVLAQTQTQNFSLAGTYSGSGSTNILDSTFFSASFEPYGGAPGTLQNFTITWSVIFSAYGTADSNPNGGSFSSSPSPTGPYDVDGSSYFGNGNGISAGGPPDEVIDPQSITVSDTDELVASQAGSTYSPSILSDVTGTSPVVLSWPVSFGMQYANLTSGGYSVSGYVSLTYDPSIDAPEPSTVSLFTAGMAGMTALVFVRRRK